MEQYRSNDLLAKNHSLHDILSINKLHKTRGHVKILSKATSTSRIENFVAGYTIRFVMFGHGHVLDRIFLDNVNGT